jgi:hypothetical protein
MTLVALCLGFGPVSMAIAWTLRFAPLDHSTGTAVALIPATSALVTPQFLRILVTGNQLLLGVESPHIRAIDFRPPVDFKQPASSTLPAAAGLPAFRSRYHLRGPEAFLLRLPQTVVGQTLQ